MKIIRYEEYNSSKGTLYDLEEPEVYKKKHLYGAVNVPYDKLMASFRSILDKNRKYFLYCSKGVRSRRAVSTLTRYGYDVTQVIN